ncbi:flagellin [Gymnodinialimonas ulvae]|uniref:flagellin n=1 Tax=Gymnodinialimonas ulvae TaxID=3126504 RepID=UPI0030B22C60
MTLVTFGDMAQFQTLRRQGADLRSDMARLTSELASGKVTDKGRALGGDFSGLADITRSLRLNDTFKNAISHAATSAAGRQTALGRISAELEGYGASLLSLAGVGNTGDLQLELAKAPDRFDAAVSALNTSFAGRSLFSADEPNVKPLVSSDAILTELRTVTAAATDAATLEAAVNAWFDNPGGGYETVAWQGGNGPAPEFLIAEGEVAETGITALDPAIRETLKGLALAALATDDAFGLSPDERSDLIVSAAQQILSSETEVVGLRARLGAEEARIEEAKVSAETARGALELEYGRLLDADPYRTATELEAVNLQLESLYILTSRMSRLSLTEFLR